MSQFDWNLVLNRQITINNLLSTLYDFIFALNYWNLKNKIQIYQNTQDIMFEMPNVFQNKRIPLYLC